MTRQVFARADQADSDCVPATDGNKPLLNSQAGGGETVSAAVPRQIMNQLTFSFTMAAGDPGGGEDLGAGSLFTARLDVSVADAKLDYKVEFHALDAGCTTQGNAAMGEADFNGAGTQTATATWDPPVADRYQVRVLVTNTDGHTGSDGTITIRTNNTITDLVIPDAPVSGDPPTEMAGSQGKGQQGPIFEKMGMISYFKRVGLLFISKNDIIVPERRLVYA